MASDVSVVVSTYDEARWDELRACLESLQRQTVAPLEVIVIVDHNERLLDRARDAFPWARVVGNSRPRGLAGARNTGVKEAGGSIVAFIDDDAIASREWLERLSESFGDEATVGVGGALVPDWVDGEASWLPGEFYWVVGCSYTGLPEQVAPVRNPIGANMAVRRATLREVGGFREGDEHDRPRAIRSRGVVRAAGNVPDDTDFAIRVSQRWPEAVWLYQPEATVHHVVPRERASLGYFLRRCFEEGSGKASLARLVGAEAGLASERRHAASVLPRGVAREVRGFLGGDGTAALRALFIVVGMVATGAGFILGGLAHGRGPRAEPPSPGFVPVRVDDVELGGPLPALPASDPETGNAFGASLCLIRLHGRPLGLIEVGLPPGGLSPDALAACVEAELGDAVARHLRDDGIEPTAVPPAGVAGPDRPRCNSARERLIDRAPTVSIVICTRGRPESVQATLRSILGSSYPAGRYEVIVVDNASAGDRPVDLEGAELPGGARLRVVPEPEPGLSHARNKGVAEAGGEIVVFADDDVEVDAEWLATLVTPFELDPEVGATSGLTLPAALETPTERWVEGFGGRRGDFSRRVYDVNDPPPDRPLFPFTVGDFGAGRNMAFRRDALAELGGFDPALGPGTLAHDGDDIEALLRVLLSGRRLVHDPAAIVWHAHPRNYDELEERVWGYGIGLTACLTRAVLDHPSLLVDLVRKLPRGVVFAAAPSSSKNAARPHDFPRALARRELRGMAYGPIAYLRSRLAQRRRAPARANSRSSR